MRAYPMVSLVRFMAEQRFHPNSARVIHRRARMHLSPGDVLPEAMLRDVFGEQRHFVSVFKAIAAFPEYVREADRLRKVVERWREKVRRDRGPSLADVLDLAMSPTPAMRELRTGEPPSEPPTSTARRPR